MYESVRKLFHCYGLVAASPALWNCSHEGQELNVPLRSTQRYFYLFMAEAHMNTRGIICTMSVPLLKLQDANSSFCWREVVFILFLLPAVLAASRSCQIHTFSTLIQLLQIFQYDLYCILQPQAYSVVWYQFNTNLANNILNTSFLLVIVLLMIFSNKHISDV